MFSRRQTLKTVSAGFGYLAFADLLHKSAAELSQSSPLAPKAPHFPAKAKEDHLSLYAGWSVSC